MSQPRAERPHMPDYGVDTADWEALPWSWAVERLTGNRNYWIVTASADGRPHALPAWGVWDADSDRFCFSCGPRSRKARNLAANPKVVVAIDDTVECVSVEGRGAEVVDDANQTRWIDPYLAKYSPIAPDLSADFLRANLLFEVTPERTFAIIEREEEFAARRSSWRSTTPSNACRSRVEPQRSSMTRVRRGGSIVTSPSIRQALPT